MIKLKNVSKFYYSKGMIASGFSKVSIELALGEFVVITGESGSGKTTLLNVISGLDGYEEGEMYIDGKETSHYTSANFEEYRKKYIGNIFQSFNLVNSYTVYQNIELSLLVNGSDKKDIHDKVYSIIEKVGLTEYAKTKCSKLSGGQKQRVAIARALAKDTPIIVADEPTGNLDSVSAKGIADLLKEISKDKLVVVVTHNYEQFEAHATRVVKMSDGKIVEDKSIKQPQIEDKFREVPSEKISLGSQIRLGVRNTFNIIPKFLLLLLVFGFVVVSITGTYTSFKNQKENREGFGYNAFFNNFSKERIVIKKKDNKEITGKDYEKLEALPNVKSIEKNDMTADTPISAESASSFMDGFPKSISSFKGKLDVGRLPERKNEIIFVGDTDYMFESNDLKEALGKEYNMSFGNGEDQSQQKIKLVGIKVEPPENMNSSGSIYFSEGMMEEIKANTYRDYSKMTLTINEKEYDGNGEYTVKPNSKVPKGETYVPDDFHYFYKSENCLYNKINIEAKNIYFKTSTSPTITKTYGKKNFESLTGLKNYSEHNGEVYINNNDFKNLFEKGFYQSSIYVENVKDIETTAKELKDLGYKPLILKDYLEDMGGQEILSIVQVPFLIIFAIGIFFIAYFVTRLILKSRGVYFTTLRMLGLAKNNLKRILDIELFTIVTIAYGLFLGLVGLVNSQIINIPYVKSLVEFLRFGDYIILYAVLLFMAFLLSRRFARRLFKKSAMSTFREEA